MRILVLAVSGVAAVAAQVLPAAANVEAYCEAYAIDFANQRETDEAFWQARRADALSACLLQYKDQPIVVKAKPKRVKPAVAADTVAAKAKTDPVEKTVTKKPANVAAAAQKPDITEGTPQWYDYCARKYSSFNRRTGTYTSRTGVERKCLVTADFQ